MNRPLTASDLAEFERMLITSGGPDALFDAAQLDRLVAVLNDVEKAALGQ